jgi:hypothetical protein
MGKKREHLYTVILESVQSGMDGSNLKDHIEAKFVGIKDSQIVKACLMAFSDSALKDDKILAKLSDLAVRHRISALSGDGSSLPPRDADVQAVMVSDVMSEDAASLEPAIDTNETKARAIKVKAVRKTSKKQAEVASSPL